MTYLALMHIWVQEDNISLEEAKRRYPEHLVRYVRDSLPEVWQVWVTGR